jgi:hypothetical protein
MVQQYLFIKSLPQSKTDVALSPDPREGRQKNFKKSAIFMGSLQQDQTEQRIEKWWG